MHCLLYGWKRKCHQGKLAIKRLTNRVRSLEKSRDHWKKLAKQRQEELQQVRQALREPSEVSPSGRRDVPRIDPNLGLRRGRPH